jgi:hypothetical protein
MEQRQYCQTHHVLGVADGEAAVGSTAAQQRKHAVSKKTCTCTHAKAKHGNCITSITTTAFD